jgi:predicted nucleic acid-binding protein
VIVLDAHALLTYFKREPGFATVRDYLQKALEDSESLLMTAVNIGEVLYIVMRGYGRERMLEIERHVYSLPIRVFGVDMELARIAAEFKAGRSISYADCFAAALAKQSNASLLTGDPEFKAVEHEVAVQWL